MSDEVTLFVAIFMPIPTKFKAEARELLGPVQREIDATDQDLRKALLKFIGDFANWDLASNRTYLEVRCLCAQDH